MLADEALSIQAQRVENSGLLAGDTLGLTSDSLRNQGVMQGAKALTLTAGESVNDGKWRSDGALTLTGSQLTNSGDLSAASMQLGLTRGLDNHTSGRLLADEALDLTTPALVNHGQVAAATLSIDGDSTTNDGTLLAKVLALHGDLQTSGILQGSQSLTWNGDTFSNLAGGQITGGDTLRLTGKTLNNQGQMESREIALAADRVDNGGRVQAQDNLQIAAAGKMTNQGDLRSQNAIGITAAQLVNDGAIAAKALTLNTPQLTNNGLVQGNGGLQLTTRDVFNGQQGQLVSGSGLALNLDRLENHGRIQAQDGFTLSGKQLINAGEIHAGALDLTLQDSLTNQGNLLAERAIAVTTDSLDNRGVLVGQNLTLGAKTLNNRGLIQADDSILATADTTTTDAAGKWLSGNALTVNGDTLSNAGVMQGGTLGVTANALTNDGVLNGLNGVNATLGGQLDNRGHIQSGGAVTIAAARILNPGRMAGDTLDLHAGTLSNDGLWQGANGLTLKGDALTTGAISRTLSGGALMLDAGQLNTQGTLQGQQVSVTADDWTHSGSLVSAGALTANVGGTLTSPGALMSHGALSLTAGTLDNAGQILSESDITLDGLQLNNRGSAQGNTLAVHQGRINNQGTLIGLQSLTLEGRPRLLARMAMAAPQQTLINGASGSLMSQGTLTIASGAVTNAGTWQGQSILLNAQSLANSGTLQSGDALQITLADNLTTAAGSKITALGTAALQALALTNQGEWAAKNLTLKGTTLTNDGTISGVDGLSVTASTLTNNRDGKVVSGQGLNVTAASLFNDGLIQGGGETRISAATQARNDGKLFSGAQMTLTTPQYAGAGWLQATDLTLNAATASNSGTWLADKATLTGDVFTNQGMTQAGNLTTNYRQLTNNGTLLGNTRLEVRGGNVTHNNGKLFSGGDLSVDSATLDGAGQAVALGNLALNLTNAFTAQGVLAANKQLAIRSQGEMTNQGTVQGNGITLEAGGRFINNGQLKAGNGTSALSGSDVALNGSGSLQSGGDVSIASRSNITLNGFTGTAGSLLLSAPGAIVNTALLYAGNNLSLFANSIHNQRGDILAGNNLVMQKDASGAANSEVINTSGTIETQNGDIAINTGYLRNTWDQISATETTTDLTASRPWLQGGAKVLVPLSELKFGVDYGYYTTRDCSGGGSPGHGAGPSCHTTIHTAALKNAPELEFALQTITVGVNAQGRASRLSSGRHLTVNAGTLSNEASAILANGNISLTGRQLDNHSWTAGTTTIYQRYASTASLSGKYAQYGSADESKLSDSAVFNRKPISYTPTGTRRTDTAGETLYRAVIQAGGAVMANFASNISNTNTASNSGRVSNTVSAPALNTLSHQTIDGGAQKQNLAGGDVASLPWKDQLQGALQQLNGGSGLDTGGVSDAALTTISTSQKGNANLGQVDGLKNAGLIDASLRGAKGDAMGQYQGKTVDTSAYPLPTGDNGYFVFSDNPKSPYLININPKLNGLGQLDSALFGELNALLGITPGTTVPVETRSVWTNEKQFIGSSYMLGRLNLNTEKDYRFLGDAAFDTRYVSNKVLNQTGSRYLNGLGSDLDQMRYLMDNAAASQKSMNLAFGVSLSADQIASLDRSMLWWESATINGETVMVPKLYLSPKDVALNNGSVIAGNNVTLKGGAIANDNSTLLASNNLTLDSQDAIGNLNNSLMQAGGDLNLSAMGDINNISATISGKTVQLESLDGSINNLTRADQWAFTANGRRGDGSVNLYGTDIGQTASIAATGGMSLKAGDNINITGAQVRAGGDLALAAGGDVMVGANQINQGLSQTNFWSAKDRSVSSTTHQGSNLAAGGNLTVQAGNDLNITASHVDAGKSAQLAAGNDINLNAGETHQNSRYANSESHASGADVSTLTAGDNLTLTARRDISSQAAGIAAEGNVGLQAGRDVNLLAEATASGDSSRSGKKTVINETVRQKGTEIASGGDTVVIAGRDVNTQAAQVQATGDIGIAAGRDVNLSTATESDYAYKEEKKTSGGFLSKKTTHTIQEDSATREAGTLLSGDNIQVQAGNNLLVKGSAVAADNTVALQAGNNVDILAATNTNTSWRFKEEHKSGLMSSGGIGFTIGSSTTKHNLREQGATQSQSFSTVGSTGGSVAISAGNQAHIGGADLIARKDLSITGDSVVIDPGHDKRTRDEIFEQRKSGLTLALSGAVGGAINNAVNAAQDAKAESDGRLAALQATKSVLSGVQAGQGVALDAANGNSPNNNNTIGVSVSLTTQKSKSEQHAQSDFVAGSTLNAGNNLSIAANGKNKGQNSGDIVIAGSQLKAGGDTRLDAQHDILLSGAANTQQISGKNSSSGGGVGIGIGVGSGGWGISVFANGNAASGKEKGRGTEWAETTIDSGKTVTINSGRDTILNGAQVSGDKIIADVGRDLLIRSQQDNNDYDSKQSSVAAGGSFTFGSMTGSGYISVNQDKMKSRYDSVQEQSGLFAGNGGFDVTVGNHTQLDGAVIASTATADKNHLDTGTLGFSDINNNADFSTQHSGGSFNSGGSIGGQFASNLANTMLSGAGHKGHEEGTTQAAVADGTITIRDTAHQKQNVSDLSRDTEHANDSISPIFDKEKEQNRLKTVQLISDVGAQAADVAKTQGELAGRKAAKDPKALAEARRQLLEEGQSPSDAEIARRAYNNVASMYGTGGVVQRSIQAVTGALTAMASGGTLAGALSKAAAPELAYTIGHRSGLSKEETLVAHALLGGVVASLQGDNAAAGAAGAISGEMVAQAILGQLYPGMNVRDLDEKDKQLVSNLATLAAGLAGNLVGGDSGSTTAGAQAGRNAVENNSLSVAQNKSRAQEMTQCQGSTACENAVIDKYKKINAEQHESVLGCKGAQDCVNKANEVGELQADYARRTSELLEKSRNNGGLSPAEQDELAVLQVTTIQLEADRNAAIHNALMSGDSSEAKQLAINSLAQAAGTSAAGIAAGVGKVVAKGTEVGQSSSIVHGGGLAAHEKAGGHLIDRHVGKSEAELFDRVSTGNTKTASTFTDRATAEAVASRAIDSNQAKIQNYLSSSQKGYLELDYQSSTAIGISVTRGSTSAVPATNARIIIGRDSSMPGGYKIITGYPTP
ncbi:hemagglutinin repeat-containing protein [Pluralibacter sp.]|uniref:hemagglutinin repeat-containing protein n=1 Tax=Pluralibacter sp. TaxID=1920032 RepID=UPI0025E87D69|nr:hemagglutinin repeat-containing protein [Pluralibacter sp.]